MQSYINQFYERINKIINDKNIINRFIYLIDMHDKMFLKNTDKNKNDYNLSICDTVHHDIKCEQCLAEPIIGYRYKCSKCNDYNLC